MENNQQYLSPETYVGIIQDLSTTISNLHVELSLSKTQLREVSEYAQQLQQKINQLTEPVEAMSTVAVEGGHNE